MTLPSDNISFLIEGDLYSTNRPNIFCAKLFCLSLNHSLTAPTKSPSDSSPPSCWQPRPPSRSGPAPSEGTGAFSLARGARCRRVARAGLGVGGTPGCRERATPSLVGGRVQRARQGAAGILGAKSPADDLST